MKSVTEGLTCVFGEKDNLLIVIFCGAMTGRETSVIDQCAADILAKPQKAVILSFRDVSTIMPASFQALAKLQKMAREGGKQLALASIRPDSKTPLIFSGIARENEMFNNIPDAWNNLNFRLGRDRRSTRIVITTATGGGKKAG